MIKKSISIFAGWTLLAACAILLLLVNPMNTAAQSSLPVQYVSNYLSTVTMDVMLPDATATNLFFDQYGRPLHTFNHLDWKAGQDSGMTNLTGAYDVVYWYDENNNPIYDENWNHISSTEYVVKTTTTFWPSNGTGITLVLPEGTTNSANPLSPPGTYAYHKGRYVSVSDTQNEPLYYTTNAYDIETKVSLYTGDGTNQVLFGISFTGYDNAAQQPITDYSNILLCGTNLNTNGMVWVLLAQGQTVDITPTLPSTYTNYTFTLNPTDYTAGIVCNGTPLTNAFHLFSGERATLSVQVFPRGGGSSLTASNFNWSIPGEHYYGFTANLTNGGPVTMLQLSYTQSSISFNWTDGGFRAVSCSFDLNGVRVTAQGTIEVKKPTADFSLHVFSSVKVDQSNYYYAGQLVPGWSLHFGTASHLTNHGVVFIYTNLNLNGYAGGFEIIFSQIGEQTIWYNAPDNQCYEYYSKGVDGGFIYSSGASLTSANLTDSPGVGFLDGALSRFYKGNQNMGMYLMFKPSGVNSIPVPIKVINWSWFGQATNSSPGGSPIWSLESNSIPSEMQGTVTSTPPSWTNHLNNHTQSVGPWR